jgi:hypothetical protein
MQTIKAPRTVYVDVDGTLVDYDLTRFSPDKYVTIDFVNGPMVVVPNLNNISVVQKFYKLGYFVIVWSHSGAEWAECVVCDLGLEPYVDLCISKAHYYIDDLPAETFMGARVWYDPVTGKDSK